MPLKIIRNDITKMQTEAIVNTASAKPFVGPGCDLAVYSAAGMSRLLAYRTEKIGTVREGESFLTPGFDLPARYIIHTVSPLYQDGKHGEEEKLRSCYRSALKLAKENEIREIAFPLIATGSFGYPREEGLRIAADEISAFLLANEMRVFLVVFDDQAVKLGGRLFPDLEEYIDRNYAAEKLEEEYGAAPIIAETAGYRSKAPCSRRLSGTVGLGKMRRLQHADSEAAAPEDSFLNFAAADSEIPNSAESDMTASEDWYASEHESRLKERMQHLSDTFSEYLLYLIRSKGMENAEVYKRAIVDKKIFSKIKNHADYHPQKLTALCLCIGARLNLDETRDLLARAGYALSPCDKTDIIFSYFIENKIYDMIELDIQLEEHGLSCIIS